MGPKMENQPLLNGGGRTKLFAGWWVVIGCALLFVGSAPGHSFGIK